MSRLCLLNVGGDEASISLLLDVSGFAPGLRLLELAIRNGSCRSTSGSSRACVNPYVPPLAENDIGCSQSMFSAFFRARRPAHAARGKLFRRRCGEESRSWP